MNKITLKKLLILSDDLVQEWCDITLQNSKGDEINIELDVNAGEVRIEYSNQEHTKRGAGYADHHDDWSDYACALIGCDPDDTDWFVSSGTLIRLAEIGQRSLEMWDTLSRYRRTGD